MEARAAVTQVTEPTFRSSLREVLPPQMGQVATDTVVQRLHMNLRTAVPQILTHRIPAAVEIRAAETVVEEMAAVEEETNMIIIAECTNPWATEALIQQLSDSWTQSKVACVSESLLSPWPSLAHSLPVSKELSLWADLLEDSVRLGSLARSHNLILCHHIPHLYARLNMPIPALPAQYLPYLGAAPEHQFIFDIPLVDSAKEFLERGISAESAKEYRHSLLLNQKISQTSNLKQTLLTGDISAQLAHALALLRL